MLIHTVNFGDLEVPEDKVITFKEGLPGFFTCHHNTNAYSYSGSAKTAGTKG
jgi:flagellar assembly factor FliW